MATNGRQRAPRNRTLTVDQAEVESLRKLLTTELPSARLSSPSDGIVLGDCTEWLEKLMPEQFDLLLLDPPYNLSKDFNGRKFPRKKVAEYTDWLDGILAACKPLLKPSATVYICGDWFTSHSVFAAASNHFTIRNRITWEREKGRGAKSNWKNASEDIWFCTVSDRYTFNVEDVKLRRRVIAPYTDENGKPKDWSRHKSGDFRDTHPSNFWSDITIPFWSMPENTDHPTQKSEKLIAKLILASTNEGDSILDPFLGSGTTLAVAHKLGRCAVGIEIDEEYALLAAKRSRMADLDTQIQGYVEGVFWERNSLSQQRTQAQKPAKTLFPT